MEEDEAVFDYSYNPNYQVVEHENGDNDEFDVSETTQVKMPTAENVPSICTSGAAYIGGNIISHGDYLAVVNPSDTTQKTLIKNNTVISEYVSTVNAVVTDLLGSRLHASEVLVDHVKPKDNSVITVNGKVTVDDN